MAANEFATGYQTIDSDTESAPPTHFSVDDEHAPVFVHGGQTHTGWIYYYYYYHYYICYATFEDLIEAVFFLSFFASIMLINRQY